MFRLQKLVDSSTSFREFEMRLEVIQIFTLADVICFPQPLIVMIKREFACKENHFFEKKDLTSTNFLKHSYQV